MATQHSVFWNDYDGDTTSEVKVFEKIASNLSEAAAHCVANVSDTRGGITYVMPQTSSRPMGSISTHENIADGFSQGFTEIGGAEIPWVVPEKMKVTMPFPFGSPDKLAYALYNNGVDDVYQIIGDLYDFEEDA